MYVMDAEVPNSHNLYSTIIGKPQKHMDLKEELTRIWQLSAVCKVQLVLPKKGKKKGKVIPLQARCGPEGG